MYKILIADDHAIVRNGIKQFILHDIPDAIITEVDNGNDLLNAAGGGIFDIVISDISMPGKTGLEALKQLKAEFPKLPVLIISIHPEEHYALRVLKAGACGYISKVCTPDELVKAIRQILSGRKYISQHIAGHMAENIGAYSHGTLHEKLSDREFEVLKMIGSGKTVSEIAEILSISVNTVSTYRHRILEKMNLHTNAEIIHYCIDNTIL